MVRKFIVHLMSISNGLFDYELNCANEDQALGIAHGIFPEARVISITERK